MVLNREFTVKCQLICFIAIILLCCFLKCVRIHDLKCTCVSSFPEFDPVDHLLYYSTKAFYISNANSKLITNIKYIKVI